MKKYLALITSEMTHDWLDLFANDDILHQITIYLSPVDTSRFLISCKALDKKLQPQLNESAKNLLFALHKDKTLHHDAQEQLIKLYRLYDSPHFQSKNPCPILVNLFKDSKDNYEACTQAYTILQQNTAVLTEEQEQNLITLYNCLNTPLKAPPKALPEALPEALPLLGMNTVNSMRDKPLDLDALSTHIQDYIKTMLSIEKHALFSKICENPGNNEAKAEHTRTLTQWITDHPLLVFSKDESGATPLHWAAENGHTPVADYLINKGALVNAAVTDGAFISFTPLTWTALNGHEEIAQLLIDNGALVNASITEDEWKGYTPLHISIIKGTTIVAKLLLSRGAQVNATDDEGSTPLHSAARCGQNKTAKLLIDNGALVNATDDEGSTPLHLAAQYGEKETA